jgi:phage portal protein BeeE
MAVEYKTPGGIILPTPPWAGKADRTQPAVIRTMSGGYSTQRFTQYNQYLQAIRLPWVHRVVLKISETFAHNDWNLKEGDRIVDDAYDAFLQLMERPNPWMSGYAFLEMLSMYMELLGEAFITLESMDSNGRPHELYCPNPANMIVVPDPHELHQGLRLHGRLTGRRFLTTPTKSSTSSCRTR